MEPCTQDGLKHYSVTSPPCGGEYFEGYRIPNTECSCWVVVLTANPSKAKGMAIKHDEFKDWIQDSRGSSPFKGLIVKRFTCSHGLCWECMDQDYCEQCDIELQNEEYLKTLLEKGN